MITLGFSALILLVETLARRREGLREQRLLADIEEEYNTFRRLGRL